MSLGAATTLDLGGSTLTLASGGLLSTGGGTIQDGTLTAGPGNELVASTFNGPLTISAAINGNAALTTVGLMNGVSINGNISNTPILNLNALAGTTITGTITGVSTINIG